MSREIKALKSPSRSYSTALPVPGSAFEQQRARIEHMEKMMESLMNRQFMFGQSLFDDPFFSQPARPDSLLDRLFSKNNSAFSFSGASGIEIMESDDAYKVLVPVPEGQKVELNTEIKGNILSVSGTFQSEQSNRSGTGFSGSASVSQFSQSVTLPQPIDADKMKTVQKDHQVIITIPKA
jgi:HSP20 family molecular chaperone IbpA